MSEMAFQSQWLGRAYGTPVHEERGRHCNRAGRPQGAQEIEWPWRPSLRGFCMNKNEPSRFQVGLTYVVVVTAVVLLLIGILLHGLSLQVQQRFWSDIFGRIYGPMSFRFLLQPAMAFIASVPDGIADARQGHSSFFWTKPLDRTVQRGRLRQGLFSTARVLFLGIIMDVIYQLREFDQFYPAEAVIMAVLIALIPYFVFRWLIQHFARRSIRTSGKRS